MIRVIKNKEPEWFIDWKKGDSEDWAPSFAALRTDNKTKLKQSLIEEQGYLCCYCGKRIHSDNSHIEHFKPQSTNKESELEYNNLLVSCIKLPPKKNNLSSSSLKKQPKTFITQCGFAKSNHLDKELCISPLDDDCESYFKYDLSGQISSSNDKGQYMITLLNLNSLNLSQSRKHLLNNFFNQNIDPFTFEELHKLYNKFNLLDETGQYYEFRQVISRYIEELLNTKKSD
jgi:uncharacterized protein (TIGR02646 family)